MVCGCGVGVWVSLCVVCGCGVGVWVGMGMGWCLLCVVCVRVCVCAYICMRVLVSVLVHACVQYMLVCMHSYTVPISECVPIAHHRPEHFP